MAARLATVERLEGQVKKQADGPEGRNPGAVPRSIFCPLALESALIVAVKEAHTDGANGSEEFHLVFNSSGKEALDVVYVYDKQGALVITLLRSLPPGWRMAFQPGADNAFKFIVSSDETTGCLFQFDSANPFASQAVPMAQ